MDQWRGLALTAEQLRSVREAAAWCELKGDLYIEDASLFWDDELEPDSWETFGEACSVLEHLKELRHAQLRRWSGLPADECVELGRIVRVNLSESLG